MNQMQINKDLKQKIKSQCPFLHLSDINLILKQLKQDKPHLDIVMDHRINARTLNSFKNFYGEKDQEIECLQMVVFDKIEGIKKIIEIFLVQQLEQQLQLFLAHIDLCKNLLRTDLVLKILDSYYLDEQNADSDEALFYIIEYEYFDYSNRDIYGFNSQREQQQNKNDCFEDQQHQEQIENHLYSIYLYCDLNLYPQKKKRQQIIASDIKNLSYITFQKQEGKSEIIKLNPIDGYLFERDIINETQIHKNDLKYKYPKLFFQPEFEIQITKQNFISQSKCPSHIEQYSEVLQNIVTVNEQSNDDLRFQFQEREKEINILASEQDQKTSLKITKFNSLEEAQTAFNQTSQKITELNQIQIQSNIVKQEIISNQQGIFIVKYIDQSMIKEMKKLVEIEQRNVKINFDFSGSQIFQMSLQEVEIYTKLILWLIANIRSLQKLQVQPDNLFISSDGYIYLNDSLDGSTSQFYDSNEILIKKYTQTIINIFDLDIFWKLFDHQIFNKKLSQKAKVETLIRNYFYSIDFKEAVWNVAAQQELENIFNRLLQLKTTNEKYETMNLQISQNSLDHYLFYQNQWIFIKNTIQVLKENKNIYEIRNDAQFDSKCIPSQLLDLFKQQFYQIDFGNNNISKEDLMQQIGQLIEQGLMMRQDQTHKYINKVKELTLQQLDKLYDLNTLQLKPVNFNQNHPSCSCFILQDILDINQVLSIMTQYFILMVILDEQNKLTDFIQGKCLLSEIIEFQNQIVQDQHNLKKISYGFSQCPLLTKALKSQVDFFNFKNKQNIISLLVFIYEKQLPDICKQLSQNRNNVNSLEVVCYGGNKRSKNKLKKIPYLVKLS